MRTIVLAAAFGIFLAPAAALAQAPSTTRIETRPFYGATVTLEEGVRVFRPLPPHGRVIINPGGKTPLGLSIEETNSVSHNYHHEAPSARDGREPTYYGSHAGWVGGHGGKGPKGHPTAARHPGGIHPPKH